MDDHLPVRYFLNGADYFQVFTDRHHRRFGRIGNVCRLVVYLNDKPDTKQLEQRLNRMPFFQWLSSLRLKTSFWFRFPYWQASAAQPISIQRHKFIGDEIFDYNDLFYKDIRVEKEPPITFDLLEFESDWALVYSWNHILMDARGAELLMAHFCDGSEVRFISESTPIRLSWGDRLKEITKVKNFLVPNVQNGIQLLSRKKRKSHVCYRTIAFSKEETEKMDTKAQRVNAGLIKSLFYLASVQLAFNEMTENPDQPAWIPVPQDQRKKGQAGPIMSNQVSFMFYSLHPNIKTVNEAVVALKDQMMDQMRQRMPQSYWVMMDSMRRFPSYLYRHLVASPSKGALASFFFSDTGHSLDTLTSLGGATIADAVHYPPNSAYPGLTIIFMRRQGRQRIVYSFPEDAMMKEQLNGFEERLRINLLEE